MNNGTFFSSTMLLAVKYCCNLSIQSDQSSEFQAEILAAYHARDDRHILWLEILSFSPRLLSISAQILLISRQ